MSDLNPQERIGTAERHAAADALSDHLAAGRLDQAEYESRRERAGAAVTRTDLDALFADLPAAPAAPAGASYAPPAPSPVLQPYQPPAGAERPMDRQMTHQPAKHTPPEQVTRMLAISGGLSTVAFLFIGFVLHGWAWGWIVFMIPGLVRGYYGIEGRDRSDQRDRRDR